jgi:glutamyl-tRNA reductase
LQLFDNDDIKTVQDKALEARRNEIPKVLAIVDEEMSRLELTLRKLSMQPLIDGLRKKAETIGQLWAE